MNKFFNKFLIVMVGIILLSGLYIFFSDSLNSEAAGSSTDSSLSSSTGANPASVATIDQKIAEETAFISTLASITDIKIESALFSNKLFTDLKDNNVDLQEDSVGRINPFALIDANSAQNIASFAPGVVTNAATQITNKGAIFSGTVTGPNVTSTYFEYGITESLGKVTPPVKQSLIGGFVTTINGLNSKTQYFYRADAKVNGVPIQGTVVSFTTN